jgi:multiple sugar transport system substrate-binding protein
MRNAKRFLALLLAMMLIMGMSVGCTKAPEQTIAPEATTVAAIETTAAQIIEELADPRDIYEPIDLGGRTIRIAGWWTAPIAYSDMEEPDPATALPEFLAKWDNLKRVEEKYNIRIEFIEVPLEELAPQVSTSVLAGDPFADIVYFKTSSAVPAIVNDLLTPLKDMVKPNSDVMNGNIAVVPVRTFFEDVYMVRNVNVDGPAIFMAYNKTMLDNLGLKDPQEIYKSKSSDWNWDLFLEYAKAATRDSNGDGTVDQYGLRAWASYLFSPFIIANGGQIMDDVNVKHGLDNPRTVEALEFIDKLYNVDKVVYQETQDWWDWNLHAMGFKEGNALFFPVFNWGVTGVDLPFDHRLMPFPQGPGFNGKTYGYSYDGYVVPKGVKDPQAVYQVLEELLWFFGDDPGLRNDSTVEWIETGWKTQYCVDMSIKIIQEQGQAEYYESIPGFDFGNVVTAIYKGEKTVAQALEELKPVAKDSIDAVFNK